MLHFFFFSHSVVVLYRSPNSADQVTHSTIVSVLDERAHHPLSLLNAEGYFYNFYELCSMITFHICIVAAWSHYVL